MKPTCLAAGRDALLLSLLQYLQARDVMPTSLQQVQRAWHSLMSHQQLQASEVQGPTEEVGPFADCSGNCCNNQALKRERLPQKSTAMLDISPLMDSSNVIQPTYCPCAKRSTASRCLTPTGLASFPILPLLTPNPSGLPRGTLHHSCLQCPTAYLHTSPLCTPASTPQD